MTNTRASWIFGATVRLHQAMNSIAVILRLSQGFNFTKARPTFSPLPVKLEPVTSRAVSTAGLFRISSSICVRTSRVRAMVAPGGSCTSTSA